MCSFAIANLSKILIARYVKRFLENRKYLPQLPNIRRNQRRKIKNGLDGNLNCDLRLSRLFQVLEHRHVSICKMSLNQFSVLNMRLENTMSTIPTCELEEYLFELFRASVQLKDSRSELRLSIL